MKTISRHAATVAARQLRALSVSGCNARVNTRNGSVEVLDREVFHSHGWWAAVEVQTREMGGLSTSEIADYLVSTHEAHLDLLAREDES